WCDTRMANLLARLGLGTGNYAYVTARVRAKKAKLLPADEYARLLARDASEIARTLQEGTYKAEIDSLAARYRGAELVERATSLMEAENALDHAYYEDLLASVPRRGAANRAFGEWVRNEIDVTNLKTLFRLRFAGVSDWEPFFLDGGLEVRRETAQRIVRGSD